MRGVTPNCLHCGSLTLIENWKADCLVNYAEEWYRQKIREYGSELYQDKVTQTLFNFLPFPSSSDSYLGLCQTSMMELFWKDR